MRFILTLCLSAVIGAAAAQRAPIEFEEYDLDNGLHVILHEDHTAPVAMVSVMYHVGSKNEDPTRTGMAHFFEHLLFEGSENIGRGEFFKYIQNAGGQNNANTSNDRTFYYEVLPSNQLELGLWLESERMFQARGETIGIETQREVVKEERRQRVDNQPYGNLIEETMKRAYRQHPYRWPVIGSMDHLNAAEDEEFTAFYETFYVPNNAVLSIAGDFDRKALKRMIDDYFGPIPKGTVDIPRPDIDEPFKMKEVRDTIWGDDQLPLVLMAYPIPAEGTPDYYAVDLLNTALSGGQSSRLNRAVVDEQELAVFCGAFSFGLEDPGQTIAYAVANIGTDPAEVETAMMTEINKVKAKGITDAELEKLKNQVESSFVQGNSTMRGIAESLANYHMYYGDANLINNEIDRYMSVTAEDIQAAAVKYYNHDRRVVLYFMNENAQ